MSALLLLYVLLGGVLMGVSPNEVAGIPLSPLAWVCYVPLLFAFRTCNNVAAAYGYAFVFFLCCLIVGLFSFMQVYFVGGALLILIGALIFALPVLPWYLIRNKVGWYAGLLVFPLLWPPYEWYLAERLFSMPILTISITQAPMVWLNQYIDITGHSGISVWLMSINVVVVLGIDSWWRPRRGIVAGERQSDEAGLTMESVGNVSVRFPLGSSNEAGSTIDAASGTSAGRVRGDFAGTPRRKPATAPRWFRSGTDRFFTDFSNIANFTNIVIRIEQTLKRQSPQRYAVVLAALFLLPLLYFGYTFRTLPESFHGTTRVSLIQPNLNSADYVNDSTAVAALMKLVTLTDALVTSDTTDLIIWPENAVPLPFLRSQGAQQLLFAKVLEWETTLLTGTFDFQVYDNEADIPALPRYLGRDYEIFNAAIMLTPQLAWRSLADNLDIRTLLVYRKQNLMHFTERVPLSDRYPVLSRFSVFGDDGSYSAGIDNLSLNFLSRDDRIVQVSPIICWDLLYSNISAKTVQTGATFIAAVTNESQVGDQITTMAHEMQSFTRLRSIESRRSIAKVSLTGYTFFTDPFGRVYGRVPWWSEQVSTEQVVLSSAVSVFSRYPGYFPRLCLGLVAGLILLLHLPHGPSRLQQKRQTLKKRTETI
jgi:apolipoprotein N-acyltransferase